MLLKTLVLKNNSLLLYKISHLQEQLKTKDYDPLLNYIFSYLYSIYYNQFPHKRSILNVNIDDLVAQFLNLCGNYEEKGFFKKILKITDHEEKILKNFLIYNTKNFIKQLNYCLNNNSYIDYVKFLDFIYDLDDNSINFVHFMYENGYNSYDKDSYYNHYYNIISELNINNLLKKYIVLTNKIDNNKKINFENIIYNIISICKNFKNNKNFIDKLSNDKKGIIIIKKIGPPTYMKLDGSIEKFNKNNINKYLNYEVISEINSKHGLYIYTHIIHNFISFKGYNL